MSVIRAKYQYTEAEAIRASREVTNAISFRVRFLPVIGILMLFGAGVSALSDGFKNPPIIIFILGSSLAFMPLFIRYESKKWFKKTHRQTM